MSETSRMILEINGIICVTISESNRMMTTMVKMAKSQSGKLRFLTRILRKRATMG